MPEENNDARDATRESFPSDSVSDRASASLPDLATYSAADIPALEARLLQLLCQIPVGIERAGIFAQLLSAPRGYHWQIPEHEVIFQTLARSPQLSGIALRAVLPAQFTRAGFPDIDIASYFAPLEIPTKTIMDYAWKFVGAIMEPH